MKIYAIPIAKGKIAYHCHSLYKPSGLVGKLINKATDKWDLLSKSPMDSFKHKFFIRCSDVLDKIDSREWFLKSVPPFQKDLSPSKIEILHPSSLAPAHIQKDLKDLLSERVLLHRRYFFLNSAIFPLTFFVSLLPVPNLPLFYVSFRGYSHYFAYQGGKHLNLLLNNDSITYSVSTKLDRHLGAKLLGELAPVAKDTEVKVGGDAQLQASSYSSILKWLSEDLGLPKLSIDVSRAVKQFLTSQTTRKDK